MIGKTIKNLLNERHMTMAELARICETPTTTLYSIIQRNNNNINVGLLLKISGALDVPVWHFFSGLSTALAELPDGDEWSLLRNYRALDAHGREIVDLVLRAELKQNRSGS